MKYVTVTAKDFSAALHSLKMNYGDDAIPISHKEVKGGIFFLHPLKKKRVELTGAASESTEIDKVKRNEKGEIVLSEEEYLSLKECEQEYVQANKTILKMHNARSSDFSGTATEERFNTLPDTLCVEFGYRIIPAADPEQGGFLCDRITAIRKRCSTETGIPLAPIRVRYNDELEPDHYAISIRGVITATAAIRPGKALVIGDGKMTMTIDGEKTVEPVFGLNALWIDKSRTRIAARRGFTVYDEAQIIATHLYEIVTAHAHEILCLQDVQLLIDGVSKEHPALAKRIAEERSVSPELILLVLKNLLRENISIRNIVTIMETILCFFKHTEDPDLLAEYVRRALAYQICSKLAGNDGIIRAVTVDPQVESMLQQAMQESKRGILMQDSTKRKILSDSFLQAAASGSKPEQPAVFLVSSSIRKAVFLLIEGIVRDATVISFEELVPGMKVEVQATVCL